MEDDNMMMAGEEEMIVEQNETEQAEQTKTDDDAPAAKDASDDASIKSILLDTSDSSINNEDSEKDLNDSDKSMELTNTSKGKRELKMLLKLNKEANLETNISHKRRSIDPVTKLVEKIDASKTSEQKKRQASEDDDVVNDTDGADVGEKMQKKSLKIDTTMNKSNRDTFCWRCHNGNVTVYCETCPRSYHTKCMKQTVINDPEHWQCPECVNILNAESVKTRSAYLKEMNLDHLCVLLKFALKRMIRCSETEPFIKPVNEKEFPDYKEYIVNPMDLTKLDTNLRNNLYGSTTAFEADTRWILHNSIIFNSYQSKLTTTAKAIMKTCKQEMNEIQNCPTCYLKANSITKWFIEVCPKPHILVWAKLKSFPYWPAKAMSMNASGMVDVRFFGAHDRAWVPVKDCFLYSLKDPNLYKQKRTDISKSIEELNEHIEKLKEVYGVFNYAPYKTPYNPKEESKQLEIFLPNYRTRLSTEETVADESKTMENEKTKLETSPATTVAAPILAAPINTYEILDSDDDCELISEEDEEEDDEEEEEEEEEEEVNDSNSMNKRISTSSLESKASKRTTAEEIVETPHKLSRRSSIQSTHSDSSHFSNNSQKSTKANDETNSEQQQHQQQQQQDLTKKLNMADKIMMKLKDIQTADETMEKVRQIIGVNSVSLSLNDKEKMKRSHSEIDLSKRKHDQQQAADKVIVGTSNSPTDTDTEAVDGKKKYVDEAEPPAKFIKLVDIKSISVVPARKSESVLDKQLLTVKLNKAKAEKQKPPPEANNQQQQVAETSPTTTSAQQTETAALLEKKKEIFLALNIQEKSNVGISSSNSAGASDDNKKQREIRTRSKTEEKLSARSVLINGESPKSKSDDKPESKQKAKKSFPRPGDTYKDLSNIIRNSPNIKPTHTYSNKRIVSANVPSLVPVSKPLPPIVTTAVQASTTNSQHTAVPASANVRSVSALLVSVPRDEVPKAVQNEVQNTTTVVNKSKANQVALNDHIISMLNNLAPSYKTTSVNSILRRSPPPITPKPQSILQNDYQDNHVPSSAGPVAEKINSMAYRISDYFRSMLVETIKDIGKQEDSTEITVASLKLEVERLKSKHEKEMTEIKKNFSDTLEDLQKSFREDKQKLMQEIKAACEVDAIHRVQEAKSKQWCANCYKEAQFYCCWNTNYCGFPCQRWHWPKHMSKCTQNAAGGGGGPENVSNVTTTRRILPKPTKSYITVPSANNKSLNLIPVSTVSSLSDLPKSGSNADLLETVTSTIGGGKFVLKSGTIPKTLNIIALTTIVSGSSTTVTTSSANVPKSIALIDTTNGTSTMIACKPANNQSGSSTATTVVASAVAPAATTTTTPSSSQ